jgi:nucleoside-diphosphate-sugar epimerase
VKSGDPLNWRADVSILKEMGYRPSVSIYEGIKKYIQWIKELK